MTVRVGLVGAGRMGRVHTLALAAIADADVTHVYDADAAHAQAFVDEFRIPTVAGSLAEVVEADDVDAVIVATPSTLHFEPVTAALRAGKHVLVEKPLATSVDEARAMAAAAEEAGRVLMCGYNLRYEPRYRMVKDWLRAGDRGATVSMYLRRFRPERVPLTSVIAWENGSHDIDAALWLSGRRAEVVFAMQEGGPGNEFPRGFWGMAQLAGGPVLTVEVVWLLPAAAQLERGDELQLVTERGVARIDLVHTGTEFWQHDGRMSQDPIFDANSFSPISLSMRGELEDFIRVVQGDTSRSEASLQDAVHAVEIVDAMIRSAKSGAPVGL